jgi:hypothetical protein
MESLLHGYDSDGDADVGRGGLEGSETIKGIQGPAAKPEKGGVSAAEPGSLEKSKYQTRYNQTADPPIQKVLHYNVCSRSLARLLTTACMQLQAARSGCTACGLQGQWW